MPCWICWRSPPGERAWINDLQLADAVQLAAAVFEVNADFSWRTSSRRFRARPSDFTPTLRSLTKLGWDSAVARLIHAGHRLGRL